MAENLPTPTAQLPLAKPCDQTAEYIAAYVTPSVLTLEALAVSTRAFSKDVNSMLQQLGIWQKELRDAEFDEESGDVRARMHNCDMRQKAMAATLTEVSNLLQRLRLHVKDLEGDQAELKRCTTVTPDAPPTV